MTEPARYRDALDVLDALIWIEEGSIWGLAYQRVRDLLLAGTTGAELRAQGRLSLRHIGFVEHPDGSPGPWPRADAGGMNRP